MLQKEKSVLQNFEEAIQHEWLETNGLGGWASSSIIGCNTRRYHGLLLAAIKPPAERMSMISRLDETLVINENRFELGSNLYANNAIHPKGHELLAGFTRKLFPEWVYEISTVCLKKTIAMIHNENTTVVIYDVMKADQPISLELLPLISARGYHSLQHAHTNIFWDVQFDNGIFSNQPHETAPRIYISVPGSEFKHHPHWFYSFNYTVEKYRGLDFEEDLFNHGTFSVQMKEGDSLGIILSTESPAGRDAHELLSKESLRRQLLLNNEPKDEIIQQLALAADQFIVKRGENLKTIIAGYHWFTDWGRDTMISLPGLCLSTGRFSDAKKILAEFAKNLSMGMLPNRFQDNNEPPEYNNVDGTLWYFVAIYKYLQATQDREFVLNEMLPVLKDITDWHFKGTRYNIHAHEDGLLYAGEKGQQLTWMDARIGNWVVTPRMGKPVEIQALWYNSLKIFAEFLTMNNQIEDARLVNISADKAKRSFINKFWFSDGGYLYDVIDENGIPDNTLRPNQLLALSLPFPLIEDERALSILKIVEQKLYTPAGLRSLPADHPAYASVYGGDPFKRDSSYHQGTVWSWLLGPYVDAMVKTDTITGKQKAKEVIARFQYHLNEGCIGSVSEIFDADAPHHPRGCVAQAWGVAEVLRVIIDYNLADEEKIKIKEKKKKEKFDVD